MKGKLSAQRVVLILLVALGIYWVLESLKLNLWVRKGPGGGFLPLIAGSMCVFFALKTLISEWKKEDTSHFDKKALYPIGSILLAVLAIYVIGMFFSMILLIFFWLFFYEKTPLKNSILVAVIWPSVLYAVFVIWLQSPLPKGLLGLL